MKQMETKLNDHFDKIERKLTEVSDTMKSLNKKVAANSSSIQMLDTKVDNMEQLSKKNSLRITGLADGETENLVDLVVSLINEKLRIPCSSRDIDTAFRLRRTGEDDPTKPRTILVNFVQNLKRNEIFSAKKLLKDTDVALFEDLTKPRYELLQAAKSKYGKKKVWSSTGRIYRWDMDCNKKLLVKRDEVGI